FGSRLLVPVSDAMLAQFADNFRTAAAAVPVAAPAAAPAAGAPAESTEIRMVQGAEAPGAVPAAAPAAPRPPAVPVKELNALALMWAVIKSWFAGLFGKKA
ncbi:MAG: carbon monoxide dehydrogenase, partial [Betaproteobacteria bacterium]